MLGLEYSGSDMLFVVGCPRSGTTWVQRLLASHPGIRTGQESDIFDQYIGPQLRAWEHELDPQASGRGGVGLGCYFEDSQFRRLLKGYLLQLLEPMLGRLEAGQLFLEKTPGHVLFVHEIHQLLPEARFVHVLRDARDTVASLLGASRGWGHAWAPRQARQAAAMWVNHVQAARHARQALPEGQFFEVRYEALHSDGPRVLGSLADWLRVPWNAAEIAAAMASNSPSAARAGHGTPIPLGGQFASTVGPVVQEPPGFVRQARAGSWQTDLSMFDKLAVWHVARRTMAQVGYPWSAPWSP